ncbi:hypothetical protein [Sulfurimonas sp.]|uniref:hypothetical protein n=1 Tax=Sulfurimonas sp. TaxID=2022749 RepID=UPI00263280ED|nr:hypothetical protein [Sulfurimonas sp.]
MIREMIRPQYTSLNISIPTSYIDRDIEIIMFPVDEKNMDEKKLSTSNKSLKGVFSSYANKSLVDLEEDAWKQHIIEKYSND